MKSKSLVAMSFLIAIAACNKKPEETSADKQASAAPTESSVTITSPADGDKFAGKAEIQVNYDITIAGDGDHAHLYVDDRRLAMLRKMNGSYLIFPQDPGVREICIKVVNSNHTPIGVSKCVKVTVK
ncbi:MAG: hypothetical protein WA632_07895 [Gallionella sp.]